MARDRGARIVVALLGAVAACSLTATTNTAGAEPTTTILNNGPAGNRIDLAIVGDGYTAGEQAKFHTDVDSAVNAMFQQEPFKEYQPYFNVHRIDVASAQSGADHPERSPAVFVNTAFDAAYNCAGIVRLICVNGAKVSNVVNNNLAATQRDLTLVLVNDPEYGGSGGSPTVASTEPNVVELILHELGHSFGMLADEYGGGLNNPNCSGSEPIEPNATRNINRATIKWAPWIDASTPLPTTSPVPGVPGAYEGAAYCDTGVYRPTDRSKMRALDQPYEQVNTEQLVKRVYSIASPLDASMPPGENAAFRAGGSELFTVSPLAPATHSLEVTWTLDGQAVGIGTQYNLVFNGLRPGPHTVAVTIRDTTAMVRSDPSNLLSETRSWAVSAPVGPSDFDGSGSTDLAVFRPSNATWFVRSGVSAGWGTTGDIPVAGDYDGNGTTDIAVYRPSAGTWYVRNGASVTWGASGDIPVPADYDGNGTTDMAVYRPATGTWYVRNGTTAAWGASADIPVPGDYDGNGVADLAVFRPSTGIWYVRNGITPAWGASGDIPVPINYDGNSTTDIAVFRPSTGTWYVRDGVTVGWGTAGDMPVPGDYDFNGTTDIAAFRPSNGTWYVRNGATLGWGGNGDMPIPLPASVGRFFFSPPYP